MPAERSPGAARARCTAAATAIDRGAHQLLSGRVGSLRIDAGKLRGDRELDTVAQHGNGLRERDGARGKPGEVGRDRVAHRLRTGARDLAGVRGRERDALIAQALGKSSQEKRIAARRRLTRERELGIDGIRRRRGEQPVNRRSGERT